MRYMRAAVRESTKGPTGQDNAKKILKATIPMVNRLTTGYKELEKDTEVLMNKSDAAAITATKDNLAFKREWEKWKKEVAATDAKLSGYKAEDARYKTMVDQTMVRLKKIEQDRNTLAVEFVRLARTSVSKVEKCDSKVLQNYKTVTDYVYKTTKYNKGTGWFWTSKGEGTKTTRDEIKKNVRLSDTIDRRCWIEKDKTHLEEMKKKMELINERINATRPGTNIYLYMCDTSTYPAFPR